MADSDRTAREATPAASPRCPICAKPMLDRYRPFCSKRCADVDLHRWLTGAYAIPLAEGDAPSAAEGDEVDIED